MTLSLATYGNQKPKRLLCPDWLRVLLQKLSSKMYPIPGLSLTMEVPDTHSQSNWSICWYTCVSVSSLKLVLCRKHHFNDPWALSCTGKIKKPPLKITLLTRKLNKCSLLLTYPFVEIFLKSFSINFCTTLTIFWDLKIYFLLIKKNSNY